MPPPAASTAVASSTALRYRVKQLYKQLLFLGRDWPQGYETYFRPRLHKAFTGQRQLETEDEIRKAISRAEYMVKELEAFYFLKKYRHVKRAYREDLL
ncbi:hypothetical protein PYCC9005_000789 [Savitreella phatthalungensis]